MVAAAGVSDCFVDVVVVLILQDMYGWPDEPFEEMDSTLAVQQVLEYFK